MQKWTGAAAVHWLSGPAFSAACGWVKLLIESFSSVSNSTEYKQRTCGPTLTRRPSFGWFFSFSFSFFPPPPLLSSCPNTIPRCIPGLPLDQHPLLRTAAARCVPFGLWVYSFSTFSNFLFLDLFYLFFPCHHHVKFPYYYPIPLNFEPVRYAFFIA